MQPEDGNRPDRIHNSEYFLSNLSLATLSTLHTLVIEDNSQGPALTSLHRIGSRASDDLRENADVLPYKIVDELLYFDDVEKGVRLCIPSAIEKEVFQLEHDEMGHPGYARTHERLTQGLHIHNMSTKLHDFIKYCS